MFHYETEPRFSDTDALGHINNTVYPVWFEQARISGQPFGSREGWNIRNTGVLACSNQTG